MYNNIFYIIFKQGTIIQYRNQIRVYHLNSFDLEGNTDITTPTDIILIEFNHPVYHYMKINDLKNTLESLLKIKIYYAPLSYQYYLFDLQSEEKVNELIELKKSDNSIIILLFNFVQLLYLVN